MTRAELELLGKLAMALLLPGAHSVLWRRARDAGWPAARVERFAWGVWLLTRPGLCLLVFVVLGLPVTSDVARHYVPQGLAALDGQLVYRDFDSSYGPLFPYLAAGLLALARRPETLVLAAIACEALAMRLWLRAVPELSERTRADALLMYACSPIAVWATTLAGQNQSWLAVALALAFGALARGALLRSGLWLIGGAALVKALALAPLPYLAALALRRRRAAVAVAWVLGLAVLFGPFVWLGAPVWRPLWAESLRTTSGNLPYLLGALGLGPSAGPSIGAPVVAAALSVLLAARADHPRGSHHVVLCILMLTLLLVGKKAYTTYLVIFWVPMCLTLSAQGLTAGVVASFGALSVIATLEPALWFDWLGQAPLARALSLAPARDAVYSAKLAVFVACELALVAGYVWLLQRALRALVPSPAQSPIR